MSTTPANERPAHKREHPPKPPLLSTANAFLDWLGKAWPLTALMAFILAKPYLNVMIASVESLSMHKAIWELLVYMLCAPVAVSYAIRWIGRRVRRFNPALACLLGMALWLRVITMIRGGTPVYMNDMHAAFALALLVDMGVQRHKEATLAGVAFALEAWVWVNIAAILARPAGLWAGEYLEPHFWALGDRVMYMRVLLPAVTLCIMRWKPRDKGRCAHILLTLAASAYTVARQRGGAAVVMAIFLAALTLWFSRRALPRWFHMGYMLPLSALLTAGFVLANNTGALDFLIDGVMDKAESLAVRVRVWKAAWAQIKLRPITGMGVFPLKVVRKVLTRQYHAHNQLLDIWLQGGLIALTAYVGAVLCASRALWRNRKSAAVKALTITLSLLIMLGSIEKMIRFAMFYPLLVLAADADFLAAKQRELPDMTIAGRLRLDVAAISQRGWRGRQTPPL